MRILLMCEGQNEEVLLNHLLNADALCFTRDDLIGDKQNEKLSIPKDLKDIVSCIL